MSKNEQLTKLFLTDSRELIEQSMIKLGNCISQLDLQQLWWRPESTLNSIGNIILHMCGNLRQWSVCGVGGQRDTRDREDEFANCHSLSADELLQHLSEHTQQCLAFLECLDEATLLDVYEIQGFSVNGLQAINHTITHFVGHTHQIIYITRMLLGDRYQFAWSPDQSRDQLPI